MTLHENLLRLLGDNERTEQMLAKLKLDYEIPELQQEAWLPILQQLNKDYYVARDNTAKFYSVEVLIGSLVEVATECISLLNGGLADNLALAEEVAQLHFKVSNYYSIASTLDKDKYAVHEDGSNYVICSEWLQKAGEFIQANGLVNTKNHAIWHNLIGGHESRGFEVGFFTVYPYSCVEHFKEAVRIHQEKLGSKVENVDAVELRHVLMCLASTTAQWAMAEVLSKGCVTKEVQLACDEVGEILTQLTDNVMLLKNGSPDHYRIAGCWQAKSYVSLLCGDFNTARTYIDIAEREMRDSIVVTNATGQLSAILADAAEIGVACSTAKALDSRRLSEGKFEQMYADKANKILTNIESSRFSQLARIIVHNGGVKLKHDDLEQQEVDQAIVGQEQTSAAAGGPIVTSFTTQQQQGAGYVSDEDEAEVTEGLDDSAAKSTESKKRHIFQ